MAGMSGGSERRPCPDTGRVCAPITPPGPGRFHGFVERLLRQSTPWSVLQRHLRLQLPRKPASFAAHLHSSVRRWNTPYRPVRFSGATSVGAPNLLTGEARPLRQFPECAEISRLGARNGAAGRSVPRLLGTISQPVSVPSGNRLVGPHTEPRNADGKFPPRSGLLWPPVPAIISKRHKHCHRVNDSAET